MRIGRDTLKNILELKLLTKELVEEVLDCIPGDSWQLLYAAKGAGAVILRSLDEAFELGHPLIWQIRPEPEDSPIPTAGEGIIPFERIEINGGFEVDLPYHTGTYRISIYRTPEVATRDVRMLDQVFLFCHQLANGRYFEDIGPVNEGYHKGEPVILDIGAVFPLDEILRGYAPEELFHEILDTLWQGQDYKKKYPEFYQYSADDLAITLCCYSLLVNALLEGLAKSEKDISETTENIGKQLGVVLGHYGVEDKFQFPLSESTKAQIIDKIIQGDTKAVLESLAAVLPALSPHHDILNTIAERETKAASTVILNTLNMT